MWQNVSVQVKGMRDLGMPGSFSDYIDWHVVHEKMCDVSVSKTMECNLLDIQLSHKFGKRLADRIGRQYLPTLGRKYQTVGRTQLGTLIWVVLITPSRLCVKKGAD